MGKSNIICPRCGRSMKQQFIGLQHCKCGMSWKRDVGFFERSPDMVFTLRHPVKSHIVRFRLSEGKSEQSKYPAGAVRYGSSHSVSLRRGE